jgi:hypothetical protein
VLVGGASVDPGVVAVVVVKCGGGVEDVAMVVVGVGVVAVIGAFGAVGVGVIGSGCVCSWFADRSPKIRASGSVPRTSPATTAMSWKWRSARIETNTPRAARKAMESATVRRTTTSPGPLPLVAIE